MKEVLAELARHEDPKVRALAERGVEYHNRRTRIIGLVQEALGQLRVDMKYLVFDVECTRRERDAALKGGV